MGWETRLYTQISYNRKTYNSKYDVEKDYDLNEKIIKNLKQELLGLVVCTEPIKMMSEEDKTVRYDNPLSFIMDRYNEIMEELEEYQCENWKLQKLLDDWDNCHNEEGLAIEPPSDDLFYDAKNYQEKAYLDGDFVYTDKHPTQETLFGSIVNYKGEVVDDSNSIIDKNGKFKPIEPVVQDEGDN